MMSADQPRQAAKLAPTPPSNITESEKPTKASTSAPARSKQRTTSTSSNRLKPTSGKRENIPPSTIPPPPLSGTGNRSTNNGRRHSNALSGTGSSSTAGAPSNGRVSGRSYSSSAGTKPPAPEAPSSGHGNRQHRSSVSIPAPKLSRSSSNSASSDQGQSGDAMNSLQRMITDLRSIPPINNSALSTATSPPVEGSPALKVATSSRGGNVMEKSPRSAAVPIVSPGTYVPSKVPNPNAPAFQPSRQTLEQLSEDHDAFAPLPVPVSNANPRTLAAQIQQQQQQFYQQQQQQVQQQQQQAQQQLQAQSRFAPGNYIAPRFAALAAANEPQETVNANGRPVLAPTFTFGAKPRPQEMSSIGFGSEDDFHSNPIFSGLGQQAATPNVNPGMSALLSLAASAHRRTGSEMTPALAAQYQLQQQIDELKRQQRELLMQSQQQSGYQSVPVMPLAFAQSSGDLHRHRRIQSVAPTSTSNTFGDLSGISRSNQFQNSLSQFGAQPGQQQQQQQQSIPSRHQSRASFAGPMSGGGFGLGDSSASGNPIVHARRQSAGMSHKASQPSFSGPADWAEDTFNAFGNPTSFGNAGAGAGGGTHSRQNSRTLDGSWRINGGVGSVQQGNAISGDLAQAQAQLQSIASFRAAAGGGHSKMASFALPNMLPNMLYANNTPYFNIPQQMQAFQLQIQQQAQQPQRKSLFSPYLPAASLPPLLAAGKLVIGILRVNKRNRSDAYIATEVLDADIYISGSRDRNRALDGDTVAVELLDVDEVWASKKEKEDKKRKKEENSVYNDIRGNSQAAQRKTEKKKDDVEVEGQGLMLFEDEEVTDDIKPQYAGHVVAVVERMPGQLFSGTLGLLRPSSAATKEKQEAERREREGPGARSEPRAAERPKIVWFKPTDKRVPLIAIPTEQAPTDFLERSEAYANVLFCACIKRWPITSLHPFGTLVEEIGPIGEVEVETSALLKDCNFPTEDFTESVLKCLPPLPWTIPEREYEVRKDLRESRIFTIDPDTAKDLDDALSISTNEDGTFEVGVHIADVGHFVKPNTALDRDARKRATSVYLVQRAVPMLPPVLSEELCSLVPGVERLAFSAFFTMTSDARVIKTSFAKSIIKSCAKLSYGQAQRVIEQQSLEEAEISEGHKAEDIETDIRNMQNLAKKLLDRRIKNGALGINSLKLTFKLDDDGKPVDCSVYTQRESNSLVQEFMILANTTVATMIAANFPEQAILRRHEIPLARRLEGLAKRAKRFGIELDVTSSGALERSFLDIKDENIKKLLELMSRKAMQKARYFCSGMLDIAKYAHYALSVPLYTHFTSPIRRYVDIVAHRQLAACLEDGPIESKFQMDRDTVAKMAQNCNMKKESAQLAQEQSTHLYLCLLINDLTIRYGPVIRFASVVNVLDQAFDVVIPEFGIEKRVHADQMPLENIVYEEHNSSLQLYWSERDVISYLAERDDDEHLNKVKKFGDHYAQAEIESSGKIDEEKNVPKDEAEASEESVAKDKKFSITDSIQQSKSVAQDAPVFKGLRTSSDGKHHIQEIKELMTVPVIVTADIEKSPPVIKVYAVNPYAKK